MDVVAATDEALGSMEDACVGMAALAGPCTAENG